MVHGLDHLLAAPPSLALAALVAMACWWLRGLAAGVLTFVGFVLIDSLGQWSAAMETLSLVLVSSVAALVIGIPLGILSARVPTFGAVIRPVLDFMQTMPAFVYLIPTIFFFHIGVVPGVVATVIFSLPPGVRLTELGIRGVDPEARRLLVEYAWPGNVRELENTIERAMVLCESDTIAATDLPERVREARDPVQVQLASGELSIKKTTRIIEEMLIRRALQKTRGNRTRAAEVLELSHRALLYKIKDYQITDL